MSQSREIFTEKGKTRQTDRQIIIRRRRRNRRRNRRKTEEEDGGGRDGIHQQTRQLASKEGKKEGKERMWKHIKQRRDVSAGITHKRGECVCHTRALARTCYASSKMQGEATTYNTVKANVVTVEQLVEASPKTLEIVRESLL